MRKAQEAVDELSKEGALVGQGPDEARLSRHTIAEKKSFRTQPGLPIKAAQGPKL